VSKLRFLLGPAGLPLALAERARERFSRIWPALSPRLLALARRKPPRALVIATWGAVFALPVVIEWRTGFLQSEALSKVASRLDYTVAPGPSELIVPPANGPFDERLGYSRLPEITEQLRSRGFSIEEQARFSKDLALAARLGVTPPFDEPADAGLVIRGSDGGVLYDERGKQRDFGSYDEIPPLLVRTLVLMENRSLAARGPRANPAVEWHRSVRALISWTLRHLGLPAPNEGGSTLAVQIEKYRHSAGGYTAGPVEKLRQVLSASLRAYRKGPNTEAERRRIVVDYFNTMPLSAVPDVGEVSGLRQGLRAWFGLDPDRVLEEIRHPHSPKRQAGALKPVLALICAVRAPSYYLGPGRGALESRVAFYADRLAQRGVIDDDLSVRMQMQPLRFAESGRPPARDRLAERKATEAVRNDVARLLGTANLYDLDRYDLTVESTVDSNLQAAADSLFARLADPEFVHERGLDRERVLAQGDPSKVVYSLTLLRRDADADRELIHADNLDAPLDVNRGTRMELGSTAKLRTLVHYLQIVAALRDSLSLRDRPGAGARDPITAWVAGELADDPAIPLDSLLAHALERRYSANPYETFYTGGGDHVFHNFESSENGRAYTVRDAFAHSTNLVFVRLMRDLVRYHEARLPYDAAEVFGSADDPLRVRLLREEGDRESRLILWRAWSRLHGMSVDDMAADVLQGRPNARDLAVLHFAWGGKASDLGAWLTRQGCDADAAEVAEMAEKYGKPTFGPRDYAYLLGKHPLEVWCANALRRKPGMTWKETLARSEAARREADAWLLEPGHRVAQDLRLRARVERDAFARMAPAWRRLGFPFDDLVPSLATAIGSSADRPSALADLMGILVNDGVRRRPRLIERLRFASSTPYYTVFEPPAERGERVLPTAVARAVRLALAETVNSGTAVTLRDAFSDKLGHKVSIGAKTGSGDNRYHTFARGGRLVSAAATSRTAAVVFQIDDRYYGTLTAVVDGRQAENYRFTSALPLAVLKLLAPEMERHLLDDAADEASAAAAPDRPARAAADSLRGEPSAAIP